LNGKKTTEVNHIEKQLVKKISVNLNHKSSHWINFTKNSIISNNGLSISGIKGFGGNSRKTKLSSFYHNFFQNKFFKNVIDFTKFESFKHAKIVSKQQNRNLDLDLLRHVYSFELLQQKIFNNVSTSLKKNCCVIGDGQTNFISLALFNQNIDKIISVNLPEVLLNDLALLKQLKINQEQIYFAETEKDIKYALNIKEVKVIFISASDCLFLLNLNIFLFVNIASMQEMKLTSIEKYFNIIKSNKAYFYCCNREFKTLSGGEKIIFNDYPWENSKILVDGFPEWHQFYYSFNFLKLKFKHYYNGPHKHRLVKYN